MINVDHVDHDRWDVDTELHLAVAPFVEVRDRHCQHPASDGDPINRCDVDHVVPKALGGITCQHNGQLMERGRNRDPRRRNLTAADITVWNDDPPVVAAHNRLEQLLIAADRRARVPAYN